MFQIEKKVIYCVSVWSNSHLQHQHLKLTHNSNCNTKTREQCENPLLSKRNALVLTSYAELKVKTTFSYVA